MSGSERGGNNRRRPSKRRERNEAEPSPQSRSARPSRREQPRGKKKTEKGSRELGLKYEIPRTTSVPRPKWTPLKPPSTPLPSPDCPVCGKPIRDIASAITERNSQVPVHFDCVLGRITEMEGQDPEAVISYIGGGRFGVLQYQDPQDPRSFRIKKIIEWENRENRAVWRSPIADRYSVT